MQVHVYVASACIHLTVLNSTVHAHDIFVCSGHVPRVTDGYIESGLEKFILYVERVGSTSLLQSRWHVLQQAYIIIVLLS